MSGRVAVVGAGVSGLTGAYDLRRGLGDDAHIDVFTAESTPGGLLRAATVGGVSMDVGAEAFIVRRPEALDLVTELGLADQIVSPGGLRPAVWSDGRLHPLPAPALMGVPATADALGSLIDDDARRVIDTESDRPMDWTVGADVSVGEFVAERFGDAVVARSVDPMLGGVYSALARDLGVREAIPALAQALDAGAPSLTAAVARVTGRPAGSGPVFGALRGGYRMLVDSLIGAARPSVHTGVAVRGVRAAGRRFDLDADTSIDTTGYDAVLVAAPVWAAAELLTEVAAEAATGFGRVRAAGSAVVAVAVDGPTPEHSGVLVASDADLSLKAITLSSRKWPHLAGGDHAVLRASFGRLGQPVTADDADLVHRATADLGTVFDAAGLPAPTVVDATVQRWPAGLPHYGPGHLAAMASASAALPDGVAVAGSGYRGVGVPACIGTARDGAERLLRHVNALT
ncbi:protoporphyrinogen oxidase [Gordonia humi]|uniref:Coproporphyrinogen III oxidase n=1 Tax=Gordonia humi TaxID=686429 RepID=A0A840F2N9_9ACTN|nr:oxygen-dependent protoporphyrinogen oxidase [Gordonia humi]